MNGYAMTPAQVEPIDLKTIYGDSYEVLKAHTYTDAELARDDLIESWKLKQTFKVGDKVLYTSAKYEGVIVDMVNWCTGSVEIRLRSGVTCVSVYGLKKID